MLTVSHCFPNVAYSSFRAHTDGLHFNCKIVATAVCLQSVHMFLLELHAAASGLQLDTRSSDAVGPATLKRKICSWFAVKMQTACMASFPKFGAAIKFAYTCNNSCISITADTLGMEGEYVGPHLERKPSWLEVDPAYIRSPSPEDPKNKVITK